MSASEQKNVSDNASSPGEPVRECRRCLLRDMTDQEYYTAVQRFLNVLRDDERAPSDLYEKRLRECTSCDHLINGGCTLCGCFVEMRAALKQKHCPSRPSRW